jgi:hypothetical protein
MANLFLMIIIMASCTKTASDAGTSVEHTDPPKSERVEALSIYMAWNGAGGESIDYSFYKEGVIEETSRPVNTSESGEEDVIAIEDLDAPGGRNFWFKGVIPGDVEMLFTVTSEAGKTVYEERYAIRVYDDLTLAVISKNTADMRE